MTQASKFFRPFLILIPLLALYFFIRLPNILSLPVFGDEAIYVRWSQIIKNVETLRFIPVTDGKQPLFMWISAASLKLIDDPLLASRLVSLFSGAITLTALFTISILFFNQFIAVSSALIYIFLPFTYFFDRMALADSLLSAFGTISLLLSLLLAKYKRFDLAMLLGAVLGLAWLTKSPAIYFIALAFATFYISSSNRWNQFFLPLLSSIIAFIIYNILRLGPQFHMIALRNRDYVWSIGEVLKHPFDPLLPHLKDVVSIYSNYISLPILLIFALGLAFYLKKPKSPRLIFTLLMWWMLPLIANAAIAKVFTARYILFTLPPLILLISYSLYLINTRFKLKKNYLHLVLFAFLIPNLITIYKLSFKPFTFQPSPTEAGYFSDWTSGWGIKDSANHLIQRSKEANVIVGTEGYFGTLPDGLQIYTDGTNRLTVFGVGIDITSVPEKLIDARQHGDEVYLLFNRSRLKIPQNEMNNLTLVSSYIKPDGDELLLLNLK